MDKIKDPAMLLSIINTVALVGSGAYFYRQLESLRSDIVKISNALTGVLKKISDLDRGGQHQEEAWHALNDQIKKINEQMDNLASLELFENMDEDITEIITTLAEREIYVDRPSNNQRPRRSGDRRVSPTNRREPIEDSRSNTQRRSTPAREPVRRPQQRFEPRYEAPRASTTIDAIADDDLISDVRNRQPKPMN